MELQLLAIREMRASMLQTNLQENAQFPLVCTLLCEGKRIEEGSFTNSSKNQGLYDTWPCCGG
jgi:hypothetical protein